ncbi:LysM peptidoglycan-binding domain-containing M23 family metallopeptidase [Streptomyces sp. H27-G5]|uniref:LysM peptidoglycan-binding domain-containing M23 family metallopeptidase n=1 Tax=Streptomyces sp. H27-G5 TaxID=2996698 RepID=UPI0022707BB2|nr:M23 family metallopeptidase [Streptomyces sp. H27-G5]MCY0922394.1 LysM peptidoglycan-binding domain-containing M23 family metallopeptidase [Streptomyces sp. H27-G5]
MPAKGKHRRPKTSSLSRGFAAAGTGGAALALPLIGAAGAHAAGAPATAPVAAPVSAPDAAPAAAPQAPVSLQAAPVAAKAAPTVYTVVSGDYLSKIAADRQISGGWERLYADNRQAVGSDPSLIHPGLKLTLGAAAPATRSAPAPSEAQTQSRSGKGAPSAPKSTERSAGAARADSEAGSAAKAPAKRPAASAGQGGDTSGDTSANTGTGTGFVAPVGGGISTQYRASGAMWSSGYHTGVDFIASSGTTVKAVGAGTVVSAGWGGAYGNEVVIRHADGRYSQYGHMSSLSVSTGQSVTPGQRIGLSGSTGNSSGPHLHFEIRTGPSYGSDVDPLAYLRSKGVSI